MDFVSIIILFVIGAAVGSFVNVVALRYNTGWSFVKGDSVCLSCLKPLRWYELIPIVSYISLRGRCSGCGTRFSIQYLLIELISGIALVWIFLFSNLSIFPSFLLSIIYFLLSIIFIYDLRHKIIPDPFVFIFILLSLFYTIFPSFLLSIFLNHLLASILIPLPFFLIWILSHGRLMGLGDVKFMVGMGALLGLQQGISAVFLSFWIAAFFVICAYVYKKISKRSYTIGMKTEVPFAPFLILGTIITFVFEVNFFHI